MCLNLNTPVIKSVNMQRVWEFLHGKDEHFMEEIGLFL